MLAFFSSLLRADFLIWTLWSKLVRSDNWLIQVINVLLHLSIWLFAEWSRAHFDITFVSCFLFCLVSLHLCQIWVESLRLMRRIMFMEVRLSASLCFFCVLFEVKFLLLFRIHPRVECGIEKEQPVCHESVVEIAVRTVCEGGRECEERKEKERKGNGRWRWHSRQPPPPSPPYNFFPFHFSSSCFPLSSSSSLSSPPLCPLSLLFSWWLTAVGFAFITAVSILPSLLLNVLVKHFEGQVSLSTWLSRSLFVAFFRSFLFFSPACFGALLCCSFFFSSLIFVSFLHFSSFFPSFLSFLFYSSFWICCWSASPVYWPSFRSFCLSSLPIREFCFSARSSCCFVICRRLPCHELLSLWMNVLFVQPIWPSLAYRFLFLLPMFCVQRLPNDQLWLYTAALFVLPVLAAIVQYWYDDGEKRKEKRERGNRTNTMEKILSGSRQGSSRPPDRQQKTEKGKENE